MKKKIKIIAVLFLLYVLVGSLLPFTFHPEVSQEIKDEFNREDYYGSNAEGSYRAAVIESNKEALDIRLQMFEKASERIIFSTFDIRAGNSTTDIFSALLAAADRGVKVEILVDGLFGGVHMGTKSIFYAAGSHPNIEIRFYNIPNVLKPWTMNGRLHDKYILVDDSILLLGGRNTFDYFLGDTVQGGSYDREVLVTEESTRGEKSGVMQEMLGYFEEVWNSKYCKIAYDSIPFWKGDIKPVKEELAKHYQNLITEKQILSESEVDFTARTVPIQNATLISNPTHILSKEPVVWYQLMELIKGAVQGAYIQTPYAVFSKDMYRDMKQAVKAQDNIIMQINAPAAGDNFVASADYLFNKKKLYNTGVKVYEFQGNHSSHGKSMLIDNDLSVIGSFNLDMRSVYIDTEVALVIHGEEFNGLLKEEINKLHDNSIAVDKDGKYEDNLKVKPAVMPLYKELLLKLSSILFQVFRFLI
jgi:phosphatidylserine/phosphatidylglycerophosphate/cardiolipin synthase-like enzyme